MKYVIEINDHPMNDSCTPALYRAKGFRALVFDQNGLDKLTPFETERMNSWSEGYDAGKQIGKQEANQDYGKGYDKGYYEGNTDGFEEGKRAMKEIVMKNLTKFVEGSKFKPEVAIFDACDDCRYAHKEAHEMPCVDCKHSHNDMYERK